MKLSILAMLLTAGPLVAQEPVDHEMVARIRAEGLDRSRVLEAFTHLTTVIGPRLSGSPAYNTAAAWSRDWLTGAGLAGARLEPFAFGRGWSHEGQVLEMTAPRYAPLTATKSC